MKNIAIFVFIFSLIPFEAFSQNQNSVEGDRQALVDLYNATDGDNWKNSSGWLNGNPSDSWHGVEVNNDGRVIRLDLFDNNLDGELPTSIGNLTKVRYLNIKQNLLSGSLPISLGNLENIETLLLGGLRTKDPSLTSATHPGKSGQATNKFTGKIPSEIFELKNLISLEISDQNFDEDITLPTNIGNAKSLVFLGLTRNHFTGQIPSSIGKLSNLRYLQLSFSNFLGQLPPEMGNMTELRWLWISHSPNLTGTIPSEWANLQNLDSISIAYTGLNGDYPHFLSDGTLSSLRHLNLTWNNFTGTLPEFSEDSNFRQFIISGNKMTGSVPLSITNNQSLIQFSVGWNNFSGEFPQDLSTMNNLRFIVVASNNFTGSLPLLNTTNSGLRDLRFDNNNFSGTISTEVANSWADVSILEPEVHTINIKGNNFCPGELDNLVNALNAVGKLSVLEGVSNQGECEDDNSGSGDDDSGPEDDTPSAPAIISPINGAESVPNHMTFEWGQVEADEYILHVTRVNEEGAHEEFFYSDIEEVEIVETTYTVQIDTKPETVHSWRVRGVKDGAVGEWSSVAKFTTESDGSGSDDGSGGDNGSGGGPSDDGGGSDDGLAAPDIQSPADGATDVSVTPTLEWSNLNADYYILHVSASNPAEMVIEETVEGTNFTPDTPLVGERNHQWRVRGVKDGVEGEWSSIAKFKTESVENGSGNNGKGPQKSTPAKGDDKVSKKPTFKWEPIEDAESYTIEVREASTSALFIGEEVTDTLFVSTSEMKGSTDYVWRVRATVHGQPGEWSDEWEFTTTDENEETVFEVELSQNYPNPFNPSTNIRFSIAEQQEVSLKVYDMAGRLVANLIDSNTLSAGTHSASFNAQSLASGIYFYRLITPSEIVTRKMTLMK